MEKHILEKFGGPTPEAMVESALYHVGLLNDCDFDDICISIKSSSVPNTMQAYLLASEKTDYPLHLGVTEAGTEYMARSSRRPASAVCWRSAWATPFV